MKSATADAILGLRQKESPSPVGAIVREPNGLTAGNAKS